MTQVVECREVKDSNRSKVAILATAFSPKVRSNVELRYVAHGYEPAGSMARWTDGYYSVRFMLGGAYHGKRYSLTQTGKSEAEAHFQRLTA